MTTPDLPPAAAKSICTVCHGVHITSMDLAILELAEQPPLPWCSCEDCPVCGPWQAKMKAAMERIQQGGGTPG